MNESKINLYLNDKQVEANNDETIWQVANRLGTEIPHLCYADKPGYRADGNCRACMVEIEGERVLAASCVRKPTPNMKVQTTSDTAKKSRELVFELLLDDQPERDVAHVKVLTITARENHGIFLILLWFQKTGVLILTKGLLMFLRQNLIHTRILENLFGLTLKTSKVFQITFQ